MILLQMTDNIVSHNVVNNKLYVKYSRVRINSYMVIIILSFQLILLYTIPLQTSN